MNNILDKIDKNIRESFSSQLRRIIRSKIEIGELKHGQKIPSERELCVEYGISRTTVRNALLSLVNEGLIVRYSGSGSFVKKDADLTQEGRKKIGNIGFIRCQHSISSHRITEDYIYFDILNGIQQEIAKYDQHLIFSYIIENDTNTESMIGSLLKKIDGIMLGEIRTQNFFEKIKHFPIPTILINPSIYYYDVDSIDTDNIIGAYKAVEYLIELGHKNIGIINGRITTRHASERFQGYRMALEKNGICFSEKNVTGNINWQRETGYNGMRQLLEKNPKITAVFAASDALAAGAIEAILDAGLNVPDNISIIGFDDMIIALHTKPPLTTMRVPRYEMGAYAVKRLIERINSQHLPVIKVLFTPELIVRQSCRKI
jgi:DNA-binding LacI/PurR family transcriptional regulator